MSGGAASPPARQSMWRQTVRVQLKRVARSPRAWAVAVAFFVRLLWVSLVPSHPVGDFALYRESAEYLYDQGHLPSEFLYMPGYVVLLAGLRVLWTGLFAAKMVGVVAGTVVAFSAGGIAAVVFGRRAGVVATALAALWPAGVAAASVMGTDMPAAALGTSAVYALVSWGPRRPWAAAIAAGAIFGLTAWVRAVAAPLAVLAFFYWWATGTGWRPASARTLTIVAIAFTVLLPWALRNRALYGELRFTDTHGGHTALVGANPNSEGTYSRSLNSMFTKGTGFKLFEPPERHLESDRVAYGLAKQWTAFEPLYAVGLLFAKADRLLAHERNLLYWPIYRQGVLHARDRQFFDRHRPALEGAADLFWWIVVGLAAAGVAVSVIRREHQPETFRIALALSTYPVALCGIYTLFFAEVRYHLAIVPLVFPYAACAVDAVWEATARRFRGQARTLVVATITALALFAIWSGLMAVGATLRARHRWAVTVCAYPLATETHLCLWRRRLPTQGDSPVRGTWDGIGLRVDPPFTAGVLASARTSVPVGEGHFRVRMTVTVPPPIGTAAAVALRVDGRIIARVLPTHARDAIAARRWRAVTDAPGPLTADASVPPSERLELVGEIERSGRAAMEVEVEIEPASIGSTVDGGTVWASQLIVERF